MKSLIALTLVAAFTVGTAVAGKPSYFATDTSVGRNAAKPVVMAARQDLPFDRSPSKN